MNAMDAALICRALGDANRIQIVELLMDGEMCACRLLEHFRIAQPTLSHHMKILTECGLVRSRREWKNTYYSLNCETLTAFRAYIDHLNCGSACRRRAEHDGCGLSAGESAASAANGMDDGGSGVSGTGGEGCGADSGCRCGREPDGN